MPLTSDFDSSENSPTNIQIFNYYYTYFICFFHVWETRSKVTRKCILNVSLAREYIYTCLFSQVILYSAEHLCVLSYKHFLV